MSEPAQKRRRLRRLRLNRVDLVGAGANPGAHVALHKSAEARTNETGANISHMPETPAVEPVEETEPVAVVEPEAVEPAVVEPEPVAAARDTVTKADHEAVTKALEDKIAKMEEREELRAFTDIAKSELGSLPEKADTMGQLLRKCKGALEDGEYQTLFRLLKAANAQSDTSELFKQFGNTDDTEPQSVEDQVMAKAEELRKADPSLTIQQATAKAMEGSPELRKAYGARQGI